MARCKACGGVLGRDCFNEQDCLQINISNDQCFNQVSRELSWANDVVVPDLRSRLSESVRIIGELLTTLNKKELTPQESEMCISAGIFFYQENLPEEDRHSVEVDDNNELPF